MAEQRSQETSSARLPEFGYVDPVVLARLREIATQRPLRVLSHGGGVQTNCMGYMYAAGDLPPIDVAIAADPMHEGSEVYEYMQYWYGVVQRSRYPFPLIRATAGDLWESATRVRQSRRGDKTYLATALPVFTLEGLRKGRGRRSCTRDFKIIPVQRMARRLVGSYRRSARVHMILGISTDEAIRMKPSPKRWIDHVYDLIDAGMSRIDCERQIAAYGHPPSPRSACEFCPLQSDAQWERRSPESRAQSAAMERELQAAYSATSELRSVPYLHETRVPLDQVVLRSKERWGNECEGFCGV